MNTATAVAKLLLNLKAISLNSEQPFQYTSGMKSPIYCDNRLIISYPKQRTIIIKAFLTLIKQHQPDVNVIAGTATAGIPMAAWIADHLQRPMVYIRSKEKGHGKKKQIEGNIEKGQTAIIIEDLISTGSSAVSAGLALREAGAQVSHCLSIFSYQLPQACDLFFKANINCHAISNFITLIDVVNEEGMINEQEKIQLLAWNKDPIRWGRNYK